jgi:hypothetical protein
MVRINLACHSHVILNTKTESLRESTPWNAIRETVFGWSDQTFPFDTRTGRRLHLQESPVVRVVGMAFYDAKHKGSRPKRRDTTTGPVTVWEIHPVMALIVLAEPAER